MGLFGDAFGALGGGIAGMFGDDGSDDARRKYEALGSSYRMLNPNITAQQAENDPAARAGMGDVLRELQGQYRSGGLDAIGKSQLAGAETEANRNATIRENQIGEQARAGNMGNSGVTLALKQKAGQEAGEAGNRAALGAGALAMGNRMNALGAAGGVAGRMGEQANAVSQYNAMMRQGAQQGTFDNRMAQLGGESGTISGAYGAAQNADQRNRAMWTGVGKGIGGIADKYPGMMPGGGP